MKKKANPKIRGHVTSQEREEIRSLTLRGVRQSEISRQLKIGRDTVSAWQVKMNLPTRLVWPEERIMELFRAGWAGYRISKHLHVPANQVFAVAHKNNFHREDKAGWKTPPENEARFIEAIMKREGYIRTLAKKYGVGFVRARLLAHKILGTPEFRPGAVKPPLSSNFPLKHFDEKVGQ
jgi:hypothetical protein